VKIVNLGVLRKARRRQVNSPLDVEALNQELHLEHIQEAEKSILVGKSNLPSDPKTGVFQITSGLGEIEWAHAESDLEKCIVYLLEIVDIRLHALDEYGLSPFLEKQNDSMVFAAAAGYIDKARRIGSIIVETKNSHRFDILLNDHLRKAIK
jgi:hypothetical protein